MYREHTVVLVTPAGRRRYLEVLLRHSLCQQDVVDSHHLWLNTTSQEDIAFIKQVAAAHPAYFKTIAPTNPIVGRPVENIAQFYSYCTAPKTIYIKLDDDVCFMCPNAIRNLVDFRIDHPEAFLVYPVMVCSNMEWFLEPFKPVAAWKRSDNYILEHIRRHVEFLSDPTPDRYLCDPYTIKDGQNVSINCIAWMGEDFAVFGGVVPAWPVFDEEWLVRTKTDEIKRPNLINGQSVMVHFSYTHGGTMRFIEAHTDLLSRYTELAKAMMPDLLARTSSPYF